MFHYSLKKNQAIAAILTLVLIVSMNPAQVIGLSNLSFPADNPLDSSTTIKQIEIDMVFSDPTVETYGDVCVVQVPETNYNKRNPGYPVIPAYIEQFSLPFGSTILDLSYTCSDPEIIPINGMLASGSYPSTDYGSDNSLPVYDPLVYQQDSLYPPDWIDMHTGGGLEFGEHTTFLVLRLYPVRYNPMQSQLQFCRNISVTVQYEEPSEPILDDVDVADLVIISPKKYHNLLEQLVNHKESLRVKTRLKDIEDIYREMNGRDEAEKIKYFIKQAVEEWGVTYVLLVGGLKGQTTTWDIPVRLSRVVPLEEQEYAEQSFYELRSYICPHKLYQIGLIYKLSILDRILHLILVFCLFQGFFLGTTILFQKLCLQSNVRGTFGQIS